MTNERPKLIFSQGFYTYGGETYEASSPPSVSSFKKCRQVTLKALKLDAPCEHEKCTFNGTWGGGGGEGQENVYLASFFFDIAIEVVYTSTLNPKNKKKSAN